MSAAERWREDLAGWAIPGEILAQAPQSPWIHPVAMFTVGDDIPDSPSHQLAREALPPGGSVLDVGCGGGRAAMAVSDRAGLVVGVDHQQRMLDEFAVAAERRGCPHREVLGDWPESSADCPACDIVVVHHVLFNVSEPVEFLTALNRHARHRVVIELPDRHPLSWMNPLWQRFWGLARPSGPRADDLVAVAHEAGLPAHIRHWYDVPATSRTPVSPQERVAFCRIRLCLPEERDPEVAAALDELDTSGPRATATIWWDVDP